MGDSVEDDPEGDDVVDVFEGQILAHHFVVDAVVIFVSTQHLALQAGLLHLFQNVFLYGFNIFFAFRLILGDQIADAFVLIGQHVLERDVFELFLDPVDA